MVGHHDQPMRKVTSKTTVLHLVQLVFHAFVSGDSDCCWGPPLGHGSNQDGERFFSPRHITIVEFGIDELQRGTNKLRSAYTESQHTDQTLLSTA